MRQVVGSSKTYGASSCNSGLFYTMLDTLNIFSDAVIFEPSIVLARTTRIGECWPTCGSQVCEFVCLVVACEILS